MPTDPTRDPPPVEVITDEPLIHRGICTRDPDLVLVYTGGRITCPRCGVRVPGEVRPR